MEGKRSEAVKRLWWVRTPLMSFFRGRPLWNQVAKKKVNKVKKMSEKK